MSLDTRTLMAAVCVMTTFLAVTMAFYWKTRRVYPGFGEWTVGEALAAGVYILISLRGMIPDVLSILAANALVGPIAVLRLKGTRKFLGLDRPSAVLWGVPAAMLPCLVFFLYGVDSATWRNITVSVPTGILGILTARDFLVHVPAGERIFYRATGFVMLFFALMMLVRAFFWFLMPAYSVLSPFFFNSFYFLLAPVGELAWTAGFMMMNGQRVEAELRETQEGLRTTVNRLEVTLSEVKTLSGLLPICAACKKIRDDQGYWRQIETYIRDHSGAEFSHGICPECARRLYPDIVDEIERLSG
jgi:hypothetical protein